MDISYLTIGEKVKKPKVQRCYLCWVFTVCTSFTWVLQEAPAKFMVNVPGNGLSLVKYDTMTQVLSQPKVQLQRNQLGHSHSDKETICITYFKSSDDYVRMFLLVLWKVHLAQYLFIPKPSKWWMFWREKCYIFLIDDGFFCFRFSQVHLKPHWTPNIHSILKQGDLQPNHTITTFCGIFL